MAQAVKKIVWRESVKLTIGPSIENGFYYDFDVEKPISENDFEKIEEEMKKNNKRGFTFRKIYSFKNRSYRIYEKIG